MRQGKCLVEGMGIKLKRRGEGVSLMQMHYMNAWDSQTIEILFFKDLIIYYFMHMHMRVYICKLPVCRSLQGLKNELSPLELEL